MQDVVTGDTGFFLSIKLSICLPIEALKAFAAFQQILLGPYNPIRAKKSPAESRALRSQKGGVVKKISE
jgi:hypothetical protein